VFIIVRWPAEGEEAASREHAAHLLASSPMNDLDEDSLFVRCATAVLVVEVASPKRFEANWFIAISRNWLTM
jgi:hypothetical protein